MDIPVLRVSILFLLFYSIVNTLVINKAEFSGNLQVNINHILLGGLNILILILLIGVWLKRQLFLNELAKVYLILGVLLFLGSLFRANLLGCFYSLMWFEVTLIGVMLGNSSTTKNRLVVYYVGTIFFLTIIQVYLRDGVFTFRPPLDRVVIFFLFLAILLKNVKMRILFMSFALLGQSFSGLFSFLLSYLFFAYRKLFYFVLPLGILTLIEVVSWLNENIGTYLFFGKNSEHFLTGSGRFDVLSETVDYFFKNLNWQSLIFGVGFMQEREVLATFDLLWTTDPHNEIIRAYLGLGIPGVLMLLWFWKRSFKLVGTTFPNKVFIFSAILFSMFNSVFGLKPIDVHILVLAFSYKLYS